jgi:hypothetical protein
MLLLNQDDHGAKVKSPQKLHDEQKVLTSVRASEVLILRLHLQTTLSAASDRMDMTQHGGS